MTWWLGHIKAKREFEVESQIQALGAECWVPRKLEVKRVGKKRTPQIVERPYLPNVIFMDLTDEQWHAVQSIKFLASTMKVIPEFDLRQVKTFRRLVDEENAAIRRAQENQEALEEFKPGEALKVIAGPFSEMIAEFCRVVQASHDLHPHYEAELEFMGQKTRVRLDPLDVKAAG